MNIRPASDLKYKYSEIENLAVNEDEVIYLTKDGYGSIVLLSLERYNELIKNENYNEYIENALDEADEEANNPNTKYLNHEEVFGTLRRKINGEI